MRFSLIIPCFNEAKNIPLLLDRCSSLNNSDIEIIIVDNGSTDQTQQVIKENIEKYPGCRSIRLEKNIGYGHGIIEGLNAAEGEILGWTHADLQTDPADALTGLSYFNEHGNNIFCKGKRYGRPLLDLFFTIGMSIFESILMRKKFWDINAQPTMFSKEFFESWDEPPQDFSIDLFAYYMAKKNNLSIYRFPVLFSDRAYGASHWNFGFRSRIKFIKRTISYSIKLIKKIDHK